MMVPKRIAAIFKIFLPLSISACAQVPNGPMGNGGRMMGYGYGGGLMWLMILVLIGIGVYLLLRVSKSKVSDVSNLETPLDILKRRYANGEIDSEEFDRKKKDLE